MDKRGLEGYSFCYGGWFRRGVHDNLAKEALEKVKIQEYKEWASHNMVGSLLKKRNEVFQKVAQE